ncbi:MAG: hypothetical protein QOJ40_2278 [Verrucomicrobiota bacterium]
MEIQNIRNGDAAELFILGRIDGDGAHKLEVEILATMKSGAKAIYVNLGQATFICSAGLSVLLRYFRQMKQKQLLLQATRPSPEVDAVLQTSGFRDILVEKT